MFVATRSCRLNLCLRIFSFHESQTAFRVALCDSFNTPAALDTLRDLVSKTNVYINSRGKGLNVSVVENIAHWVGQMLCIFGLGEGETSEIGWGQDDLGDGNINVSLPSFVCVALKLIVGKARGSPHAISSVSLVIPRRGSAFGDGKERHRFERYSSTLRQASRH
jgi:hypothetical protein